MDIVTIIALVIGAFLIGTMCGIFGHDIFQARRARAGAPFVGQCKSDVVDDSLGSACAAGLFGGYSGSDCDSSSSDCGGSDCGGSSGCD